VDIALQVCQLTADSSKVSDSGKSYTLANKKDFAKFLENIKDLIKKPLTDKTKENNINALLMQLLNLLNIDISIQDLETMLNQQPLNPNINLDKIEFDIKFPVDELNRCWQAIISEFNITGNINQDTVQKFYLALEKALSYEVDIDLNSLKDMINEILKNDLKTNTSESIEEIHYNNHLQESSIMGPKANTLREDKNTNSDSSDTYNLKQKTRTRISIKDETDQNNKVIIEENTAAFDKLQEHKLVQIDSNLLQYDNTSPIYTQKTFTTSLDKTAPNTITLSAKSYDTLDIFGQLVDKVQFALKGDVQQVKVRLKPDYLGDVLIKVISDKGRLKAELFVENSQIRSMLRVNSLDFQNQIREQGYNFSEINVYKMSDSLEMGAFNHQSSSNEHYQAKKFKSGFNRHQTESHPVTVTDNYSLWENTSKVNYMA